MAMPLTSEQTQTSRSRVRTEPSTRTRAPSIVNGRRLRPKQLERASAYEAVLIFDIVSADRQRLALQTCLTRAPRPMVFLYGSPIPRRKSVRSTARPLLCIGERQCTMIRGSITTRDVLLNASTIVRSFGLGTYVRCLGALLTGRRTTFRELAWPH